MVTRKNLRLRIESFLEDLRKLGYNPERVLLFGSYAKGTASELSDIDLAIWDKNFSGCLPEDAEKIVSVLVKHPGIEVHTYKAGETANDDPFIGEIIKTGKVPEEI